MRNIFKDVSTLSGDDLSVGCLRKRAIVHSVAPMGGDHRVAVIRIEAAEFWRGDCSRPGNGVHCREGGNTNCNQRNGGVDICSRPRWINQTAKEFSLL